jgi:WD40 repeat protein
MSELHCPFCNSRNTRNTKTCSVCGSPLAGLKNCQQLNSASPKHSPANSRERKKTASPEHITLKQCQPRDSIKTPTQQEAAWPLDDLVRVVGLSFWPLHDSSTALLLATSRGTILSCVAEYDALQQIAATPKKASTPHCAAFAADVGMIATGSTTGTVCLHQVVNEAESGALNGKLLRHWQAHHGPVKGLALSPEATLLASGGSDGAIMLWHTDAGNRGQVLAQGVHEVTALSFSQAGALLAGGYDHGCVQLWDIASGQLEWALTKHNLWIKSLAFSPNGNMLASGGYDGCVRLWAARTGHELDVFRHHNTSINSVAFAPDNRTLACGDTQGQVHLYDSWTGTLHYSLPPFKAAVDEITFSSQSEPLSGFMFACAAAQEISLWRLEIA